MLTPSIIAMFLMRNCIQLVTEAIITETYTVKNIFKVIQMFLSFMTYHL